MISQALKSALMENQLEQIPCVVEADGGSREYAPWCLTQEA